MEFARTIVQDLNKLLQIDLTPEQNGLQVEGTKEIKKIVFGVSANMALFEEGVKKDAQMLIVHHGLLWGHEQKITGVFGARVRFLIKNNLNLVAYHLPLDKHPVLGNNAGLAKLPTMHTKHTMNGTSRVPRLKTLEASMPNLAAASAVFVA